MNCSRFSHYVLFFLLTALILGVVVILGILTCTVRTDASLCEVDDSGTVIEDTY